MSFDAIDYLDWNIADVQTNLRERALAAWKVHQAEEERKREGQKANLLLLAHDKMLEVLGESNAENTTVEVTCVKDGDGWVRFTIDGLNFKVTVGYPAGHDGDAEPTSVTLALLFPGRAPIINCLADVGRWIEEDYS